MSLNKFSLFFCLTIAISQNFLAQTTTFKITNRALPGSIIPNNSTFYTTTSSLAAFKKEMDVVNLSNLTQEIIVRKTDLLLNVVSSTDKALPSYCFGIFCRNADTFADTVTFLPGQTVPLEFDFFEASNAGHSFIRYTISNKNNSSENDNINMDYQGVVSVTENLSPLNEYYLFPNPAKTVVYLVAKKGEAKQVSLKIKDSIGRVIYEDQVQFTHQAITLSIENYKSGIYFIELEDGLNQSLHKKLIIE